MLNNSHYTVNIITYNIIIWLLCVTIGTLAKENAIVYFVIPKIM